MRKSLRAFFLFCLISQSCYLPAEAQEALKNVGMVGVKSIHGRYLQAHTDGEMHASNEKRNEEETWFLIEVDKAKDVYALLNWRNGKFMSKRANGCVPAISQVISASEQWILVSGKRYGIQNAVAFKNREDGTFIGTNDPGKDGQCGGEVSAGSPAEPPANSAGWPGWWVLEPASNPEPGKDFWNTIGRAIQGVVKDIKPADVAALIALLAAA